MQVASLTRRHLLTTTMIGGTALVAVGCAGTTANQALQDAASDVKTIAAAFQAILPALGSVAGLSTTAVATVGAYISDLQNVATSVAGATTNAAAQTGVQQVETDINGIVAALAVLPVIPPPFSIALQAAAVLLPVIEAAIGMLIPPTPAPVTTSVARLRAAPPMSAAEARLYLKSLSAK